LIRSTCVGHGFHTATPQALAVIPPLFSVKGAHDLGLDQHGEIGTPDPCVGPPLVPARRPRARRGSLADLTVRHDSEKHPRGWASTGSSPLIDRCIAKWM
jgi:hypothetical protein